MQFSSGEKKMLALCVVAIALPLTVGLFLNRINATPVVNIPAPPKAPKPNGFDLYVAAATAMTRVKPEVDPASDVINTPTNPNVRAQRYSLARRTAWLNGNKKALGLFQQALQTPSMASPPRSFAPTFPVYARLRELARSKIAQSNTLWMRGDFNGALQINLDTVQMGHDIRRGGFLITHLVSIAISAIGRGNTGATIEHLSAAQCKNAAQRLEKLLANRWKLDQTLTEDKWATQAGMMEAFEQSDWRDAPLGKTTPFQSLRIRTISKQQMIDNIGATYDHEIANARLPFAQEIAPPASFGDSYSDLMIGILARARINEARGLMGERTLMLQLALRAYQLENGKYPPNLNALVPVYLGAVPTDPFGGGEALRYKSDGVTYKLWSIGPDGVDDLGAPIPSNKKPYPIFPKERPRVPRAFTDFDGKGDVVAGINTG